MTPPQLVEAQELVFEWTIEHRHVGRFPTRRRSCWCRTISTPTSPPRSTKPSPPPRRAGSSSASNGTTRPSTAVGSTWPR
jgi:hypothetical protein